MTLADIAELIKRIAAAPSEIELELLRRHAITCEDGVFRWRGYRYDRPA